MPTQTVLTYSSRHHCHHPRRSRVINSSVDTSNPNPICRHEPHPFPICLNPTPSPCTEDFADSTRSTVAYPSSPIPRHPQVDLRLACPDYLRTRRFFLTRASSCGQHSRRFLNPNIESTPPRMTLAAVAALVATFPLCDYLATVCYWQPQQGLRVAGSFAEVISSDTCSPRRRTVPQITAVNQQ